MLAQVLARSGLMVIPGLVLGLACALAGTRLMARMLHEVAPTDPLAIAVATATLTVVALGRVRCRRGARRA